jgi:hypothetical protein
MNVEIGAEATQFPEKEYINGIAVAVCKNIQQHMIPLNRQVIFKYHTVTAYGVQ